MALRLAPLFSSSFTICRTNPLVWVEHLPRSHCFSQARIRVATRETSPPETRSEQHGAGQFCQCDLPCSGCSDGWAGPRRSAWHGWQRPRAVVFARTCLVRSPLLRASAAARLPSGANEAMEEFRHIHRTCCLMTFLSPTQYVGAVISLLSSPFKLNQMFPGITGKVCLVKRLIFSSGKVKVFFFCLPHSWMQLLCAMGSTTHDL